MKSLRLSGLDRNESVTSLILIMTVALVVLLFTGCGDTPSATPTSAAQSAGSQIANTVEPTQSSSPNGTEQNTPAEQSVAPAIAADGTLKTAMQRVVEAQGMRFSLEYTSTMGTAMGTPDQDYVFKIEGVATGRLLPNRKVDFTLTMTKGTKGLKQNGEWIIYWVNDQLYSYFKNGTQWEEIYTPDLHDDHSNFDPVYAYNELGELTTFGPTSFTGAASPDVIAEMAAGYTMSGTEQLNGEATDHYHRVGEAGGILDLWLSKSTGDIVRFRRDVSANGIGTIADLTLSDIDKPQVVQEPK